MPLIYLYTGEQGITCLKNGYIPMGCPSNLESPWLHPGVQIQVREETALTQDEYIRHLQTQYARLPENLRSMISFEYFVKQSEPKRSDIEKAISGHRSDKSRKRFPDLSRLQKYSVLRFFASPDTPELWQRYGVSGEGVVIAIDSQAAGWCEHQKAHHFTAAKAVSSWMPDGELYWLVNQLVPLRYDEWRLIQTEEQTEKYVTVGEDRYGLFKVPARAIKQIILGYGWNSEKAKHAAAYFAQDLNYRHVSCEQLMLSQSSLALVRCPLG